MLLFSKADRSLEKFVKYVSWDTKTQLFEGRTPPKEGEGAKPARSVILAETFIDFCRWIMQKGSRKRQASQISEYSRNVHGFLKVKNANRAEEKAKSGPEARF